MGRLLALDVGGVRTGIAVTDPLQITPNGLTTVQTKSLKAFLTDYLSMLAQHVGKAVLVQVGVAVKPLDCWSKLLGSLHVRNGNKGSVP
ncbi:MAG: RuvX/YqgF family protein [Treponema sp.]|nr:RuvX/YqgF family protein [Treponema sp.]